MEKQKFKKNIQMLSLLNLFMDLKLYGVIAIIYFTQISGSMTLGMSIFSITMIVTALAEIPTGILSDKVGRKKTIVLGAIMSLIYAIFFALSNNYWLLVLGAIFEGFERAFYSGNNEAILYDILKENGKENEYNEYLGKTSSMYYVAGTIGGILGGVIAYLTSYTIIMWLSVIPKIVTVIIALNIKEPQVSLKKDTIDILKDLKNVWKLVKDNKTLKKQIIADSLSNGIGEATYQFRAKFYEMVWPVWALGIPGMLSNIGMTICSWFSGKILRKLGNRKVIIYGQYFSIISNSLGVALNNIFSPFILVTNSLIPSGIAKEDISQKIYTDEYRASMASFKSLIESLVYAMFALVVGIVADAFGVVLTLIVAQFVKIAVILIYENIFQNNKELA